MLKVWADGIQKTADYVKVHVEQSVKPILVRIQGRRNIPFEYIRFFLFTI